MRHFMANSEDDQPTLTMKFSGTLGLDLNHLVHWGFSMPFLGWCEFRNRTGILSLKYSTINIFQRCQAFESQLLTSLN